MSNDELIRRFFIDYATRFNRALAEPNAVDVEATASAFADYVVAANPSGVMGGANNDQFRAQIPNGYVFYRSIGVTEMALSGVDITPVDDLHAIVRAHWLSRYRSDRAGEGEIPFDVVYLVQVLDETPRIFAYMTGDEQQALREHGLV